MYPNPTPPPLSCFVCSFVIALMLFYSLSGLYPNQLRRSNLTSSLSCIAISYLSRIFNPCCLIFPNICVLWPLPLRVLHTSPLCVCYTHLTPLCLVSSPSLCWYLTSALCVLYLTSLCLVFLLYLCFVTPCPLRLVSPPVLYLVPVCVCVCVCVCACVRARARACVCVCVCVLCLVTNCHIFAHAFHWVKNNFYRTWIFCQ